MTTIFDIVIPLGPNEFGRFPTQLRSIIQYVIGFRRIYIICNLSHVGISSCRTDVDSFSRDYPHIDIQWIDESAFPFSMSDLLQFYPKPQRVAWYFQQLIKLYACHVLSELSDYFLIVDADVFFLKPISFFTEDHPHKPIYTVGDEYHIPYFQHMALLHPDLRRVFPDKSGICHHMMFRRTWIFSLFYFIETFHQYEPFWKIFIRHVHEHSSHPSDFPESGASEYEIFFNFLLRFHSNEISLRKLNWTNLSHDLYRRPSFESTLSLEYDYVSVCHWL